jgi:hypothetical protein
MDLLLVVSSVILEILKKNSTIMTQICIYFGFQTEIFLLKVYASMIVFIFFQNNEKNINLFLTFSYLILMKAIIKKIYSNI